MRDRDGFLTGVSLFRTVLFWPTSPTPRLPRLPSERDKHVLERAAASWEDVERYQGAVPGYLADRNMGGFRVFSIKGDVLLTGRFTPQLIFSSTPLRAPPSELLPFLRPSCSGSRESGVSEPTPVI